MKFFSRTGFEVPFCFVVIFSVYISIKNSIEDAWQKTRAKTTKRRKNARFPRIFGRLIAFFNSIFMYYINDLWENDGENCHHSKEKQHSRTCNDRFWHLNPLFQRHLTASNPSILMFFHDVRLYDGSFRRNPRTDIHDL